MVEIRAHGRGQLEELKENELMNLSMDDSFEDSSSAEGSDDHPSPEEEDYNAEAVEEMYERQDPDYFAGRLPAVTIRMPLQSPCPQANDLDLSPVERSRESNVIRIKLDEQKLNELEDASTVCFSTVGHEYQRRTGK